MSTKKKRARGHLVEMEVWGTLNPRDILHAAFPDGRVPLINVFPDEAQLVPAPDAPYEPVMLLAIRRTSESERYYLASFMASFGQGTREMALGYLNSGAPVLPLRIGHFHHVEAMPVCPS